MDFDQRSKEFKSKGRRKSKRKLYGIDDAFLNLLCAYSISMNSVIHKSGLVSLKRYLDTFTEDDFNKNQVSLLKFKFIKEALDRKLKGLYDRDIILSDINRYMDITSLVNDTTLLREISNDEVYYVEGTIANSLNMIAIDSSLDILQESIDSYRTSDFRQKNTMLNSLKESINNMQSQFRRNDVSQDTSDTLFRLSDMENDVPDIHRYVRSPSFKLVTGMQGMNAMLGGGFQKEKVYAFFAASGGGKTTTLENMLYQIWKYNKGFKTQDRSKKPCIILLTMENLVVETVCALFNIMTRGNQIKNCKTAEEVINEFKARKFEYDAGDPDSIEIVIKYKPVNSVDTNYLYTITEDLEDEGYECIAFLQDYIMRIRPAERTKDPYQDLGNVVNEFKTFAIQKKIPVITASQLNREALRIIDESRTANARNTIDKLSRANVGESVKIDQNLDGIFFIVTEYGPDNQPYLALKCFKHRYEIAPNTLMALYQPFYPTSRLALVEDLYELTPAYRESILRTKEEMQEEMNMRQYTASFNKPIEDIEDELNTYKINSNKLVQKEENHHVEKEERNITLSKDQLVEKEKKKIVYIVDKDKRDILRERFGIIKVMQ